MHQPIAAFLGLLRGVDFVNIPEFLWISSSWQAEPSYCIDLRNGPSGVAPTMLE